MSRNKIEVRHISAWFGQKKALRDINIDIPEHKVTAVIGPSGCGKSTFIRCLNRMHETVPDAQVMGEVTLEGMNIYSPEVDPVTVRQRVGMVFQKPTPFPTMSIYENVIAGLKLNGDRSRRDWDSAVATSLKQAALWDEVKDILGKPGVSLSGGQQQRLCIARALAVKPEVLLLDEPCSALDPISTAKIEELIHQFKQDLTIVIVTHNMQQAARVADFTGFFLMGDLVELDETTKIFTNPKDHRTEEYITGRFG